MKSKIMKVALTTTAVLGIIQQVMAQDWDEGPSATAANGSLVADSGQHEMRLAGNTAVATETTTFDSPRELSDWLATAAENGELGTVTIVQDAATGTAEVIYEGQQESQPAEPEREDTMSHTGPEKPLI